MFSNKRNKKTSFFNKQHKPQLKKTTKPVNPVTGKRAYTRRKNTKYTIITTPNKCDEFKSDDDNVDSNGIDEGLEHVESNVAPTIAITSLIDDKLPMGVYIRGVYAKGGHVHGTLTEKYVKYLLETNGRESTDVYSDMFIENIARIKSRIVYNYIKRVFGDDCRYSFQVSMLHNNVVGRADIILEYYKLDGNISIKHIHVIELKTTLDTIDNHNATYNARINTMLQKVLFDGGTNMLVHPTEHDKHKCQLLWYMYAYKKTNPSIDNVCINGSVLVVCGNTRENAHIVAYNNVYDDMNIAIIESLLFTVRRAPPYVLIPSLTNHDIGTDSILSDIYTNKYTANVCVDTKSRSYMELIVYINKYDNSLAIFCDCDVSIIRASDSTYNEYSDERIKSIIVSTLMKLISGLTVKLYVI